MNKRFNWHSSCFKYPSKYSFCKILNSHFDKGYCKGSSYTVNIIEKLEGTGRTDRDVMDITSKSIRKVRELYWMMELRTVYPYGLNDRMGDEYKTENTHVNVANKFPSLPMKFIRVNRGTLHKGTSKLLPNEFMSDLSRLLETSVIDIPNVIRVTLCSTKKCHLKIVHQLLNDKLSNEFSDCLFGQYFHQAVDIIESKLYKLLPPKLKKKPPDNICRIFFDNKRVELISIARILRDPEISSTLPTTSVRFPKPMVTYKLGLPLSTKSTISIIL